MIVTALIISLAIHREGVTLMSDTIRWVPSLRYYTPGRYDPSLYSPRGIPWTSGCPYARPQDGAVGNEQMVSGVKYICQHAYRCVGHFFVVFFEAIRVLENLFDTHPWFPVLFSDIYR